MIRQALALARRYCLTQYKWPLFALLFCCFAQAILGDSTAEALLLAHFDARLIPTMFLVNAVFLFCVSAFVLSLIDRVDRGLFFLILCFGHGCMLLFIRVVVQLHADFLFLPLFSYAYVTKIFLFLMFWTLVNDLIDSRRASREFPVIAAGGTLGAICVSFAIPQMLRLIRPENLLCIWAFLSLFLGVMFIPFRSAFAASFKPSPDSRKRSKRTLKNIVEDLRLVAAEPLLRNMSVFYFLLFFVLLNQHFTFYSQLKKNLFDAKELASFLGFFNGTSMAVTFLLQIGVAGFLLKKIGSTRSMLFLPAVLCIVFSALAVQGLGLFGTTASRVMFWSIVCGMGMRVAFFDSFFSPNFQIFFSSLPQEIRGRGKLSIEGVVKPAAIVCASLWLLLVAPHIPFGVSMAFLFVISGGVLLQTFNIRKKYTQSLTAYLTGFRSKKLPLLFNLVEVPDAENFVAMLGGVLAKEEYEIKRFIIEILAGMNSKESIGTLTDYMGRCDGITRATIISSLSRLKRPDLKPVFIRCLNDADDRVTANSILALAAFSDFETQEGLEVFLHHRDNRVRANAVVIMWRRWESEKRRQRLIDILQKMLWSENADESASSLYAMGVLGSRSFLGPLEGFYKTARDRIMSRPSVRRQFLTALAKIPCDKSFDLILGLSEGERANAYPEVVRGLGLLLENGFAPAGLMQQVKESTHRKRSTVLKAMVDRKYILDKSYDELLEDVAHREVASIYADWLCLSVLDTKASLPEVELLRTAVYETCVMEKTRNVIYLTALADRSGQVGSIIPRLTHPNRHIRARAFEVLDNVGMVRINRLLIGLLDSDDAATHGREAMIGHKLRAKPLMDTVSDYLFGRQEWLAICALSACNALFVSTKDVRWQDLYNRAMAADAGRAVGAVRS